MAGKNEDFGNIEEKKKRNPKFLSIDEIREKTPENSVAAFAQELPYKDDSFDAVVSLYSVPGYLSDYVGQY